MSFQYAPSQFRLPEVPNWTPPNGIWCGLGVDAGYYAFYNSSWGGYVMTKGQFSYSLKIGAAVLKPVYASINGYCYWEGSGYVYYSRVWRSFVWASEFPGYEPVEDREWDEGKEEWKFSGDSFYVLESLPYSEDRSATAVGRGRNYGKDDVEVAAVWSRWTCGREFGKYEPKGDASGFRYLGLPRFRGNGEYYVRSFARENGHYRYGAIHYAEGKWVIGEIGSDSGWHEGNEPSKDGSVTFRFTVNEGSEAQGRDITVEHLDYVKGDESAGALLGEVAIWR